MSRRHIDQNSVFDPKVCLCWHFDPGIQNDLILMSVKNLSMKMCFGTVSHKWSEILSLKIHLRLFMLRL